MLISTTKKFYFYSRTIDKMFLKGRDELNNLKLLRMQRGLSQQKLADILHVSQQSVYKYENGIANPDIDTLKNIADFFDTSIDYIVGYTDFPHKLEPMIKMPLNQEETSLIKKYQQLPPERRSLIHSIIESYFDNPNNKK